MAKREVVYMGNNFIEASYKCNPVEKKILNLGILRANKKTFPDKPNPLRIYEVTLDRADLMDTAGLDTVKDFRHIIKACKSLNEKIIVYEDEFGKEFETSSFITDSRLKNGTLTLGFHGKVVPFFNKLKERFTSYDLLQTKQFIGKYTIRFYELIKQYESIGKRTLTYQDMRKMFQLEDKYQGKNGITSFRQRVIDSAQKELKEKSDLYFDYKQNKEGRNIVSITMTIKLNAQHIDAEYYRKMIANYLTTNSIDDFHSNFKKYYQENQNNFSISEKKEIYRIIIKRIEPKNIDEKFLYHFFAWLEPPLNL